MLRVSFDFFRSLPSLDAEQIKKVPKFVQLLYGNPGLPSLRLKRLQNTDLYSARLDDAHRAILVRRGGEFILLRVGKRGDMYRWTGRVPDPEPSPSLQVDDSPATASQAVTRPLPCDEPPPAPSGEQITVGADLLEVGSIHTWGSLKRRFDWETDEHGYYLPEKAGKIVCACLRSEMNPNAPWQILVGPAAAHIRKAELFSRLSSPVPAFVQVRVNQWEYWGRFQFERCERDPGKFRHLLPENRKNNTTMVLFLKDAD